MDWRSLLQAPSSEHPHRHPTWAERWVALREAAIGANTVLVGDSNFARWPAVSPETWTTFRGVATLGMPGDRIQNLLYRLDHGQLDGLAPKVAVVMIGTNNLLDRPPSVVAAAVRSVVDRVATRVPQVILLGVPPYGGVLGVPQRASESVNRRLASFAAGAEIPYLDPQPALMGRMDTDGIHIAAAGYEALTELLAPHVADMAAVPSV